MKTSKLFTIDTEIAEKLSNIDNSSALVNELLCEYFDVRSNKSSVVEEKKAIISNLKKKADKFSKKSRFLMSLRSYISTAFRFIGLKMRGKPGNQQSSTSNSTQEEGKLTIASQNFKKDGKF